MAYFARYCRLPSGDPFHSAVLVAKGGGLPRYSARSKSSPSVATRAGHAGAGILAFYAEGRSRVELTRTLMHEICHLLNSRALAWTLPTWLEEGIATDLGLVWVEDSPDVESDPRVGGEGALQFQGFESRILFLEQLMKQGQLPSVGVVMRYDRETFHRPEIEMYAYSCCSEEPWESSVRPHTWIRSSRPKRMPAGEYSGVETSRWSECRGSAESTPDRRQRLRAFPSRFEKYVSTVELTIHRR